MSAETQGTGAALAPSVKPEEVAYYAALADQWWDNTGPFWPLHRLNHLRSEFITRALTDYYQLDPGNAPLAGLTVLDIGCGGGILAEAMAARGATVHGVDVVERNIAVARHHAATSGLDIRYDMMSVESLAATGASYDVVLNMEVVEHVADLSGFMAASTQLVRQDGLLFVATINRTLASWIAAIVGAEYVLRWLPRGTHRWADFRKPEEIEALMARDGLHVQRRTGVAVNPLTRRFSLTRHTPVNYMVMGARRAPSQAWNAARGA